MTNGVAFELFDDVVGLRYLGNKDAEAITAICQDPEISHWTTIPSPYTLDDALSFIELASIRHADSSVFHLAIIDRTDSSLVGTIRLDVTDRPRSEAGYMIAPWSRRKGFASRALALVSSWALDHQHLDQVELIIRRGNDASEGVARNVGFIVVEEMDDYVPTSGSAPIAARRWELTRKRA